MARLPATGQPVTLGSAAAARHRPPQDPIIWSDQTGVRPWTCRRTPSTGCPGDGRAPAGATPARLPGASCLHRPRQVAHHRRVRAAARCEQPTVGEPAQGGNQPNSADRGGSSSAAARCTRYARARCRDAAPVGLRARHGRLIAKATRVARSGSRRPSPRSHWCGAGRRQKSPAGRSRRSPASFRAPASRSRSSVFTSSDRSRRSGLGIHQHGD